MDNKRKNKLDFIQIKNLWCFKIHWQENENLLSEKKHLQIINLDETYSENREKKNLLELDNEKHQDPIWQINNQME